MFLLKNDTKLQVTLLQSPFDCRIRTSYLNVCFNAFASLCTECLPSCCRFITPCEPKRLKAQWLAKKPSFPSLDKSPDYSRNHKTNLAETSVQPYFSSTHQGIIQDRVKQLLIGDDLKEVFRKFFLNRACILTSVPQVRHNRFELGISTQVSVWIPLVL